MDKLIIRGGGSLRGEVEVSGEKNAALPAMAACLLTDAPISLERVPRLGDVRTIVALLSHLGVKAEVSQEALTLCAAGVSQFEAPYRLVKTMRASVLVLGPLVARFGRARVSLPGGCAIGPRPINLHLAGLEKAACEPEVTDLAVLLNRMGARIEGAGTSTITVEGVESLQGALHEVIPDRVETGTFMVAAAITGGDVTINGCLPRHLEAVSNKLHEAGVSVEEGDRSLRVWADGPARGVNVRTHPYPGFATDMQAQVMALMTTAEGTSVITETVFDNRFMHVNELLRMGANIRVVGNAAFVQGVPRLLGAPVMATDLRASASLILAGLAASGVTALSRVYHLDRGYELLERKLLGLGADIERVPE